MKFGTREYHVVPKRYGDFCENPRSDCCTSLGAVTTLSGGLGRAQIAGVNFGISRVFAVHVPILLQRDVT
jgi:hypothetical protein